jgi:predicted GIY-YIG superfamily endonuclease
MTDFFVYILECVDGSYYTGHTDNLEQRIAQHQSGQFDGYTANRLPITLAYSERYQSREAAFAAERRIKNWSRAKKQALITNDWAALKIAAQPPRERAAF